MFGPEYHKIHTVFKRDERGVILPDELSRPEFDYLSELPWRWTEKIDGTNVRVHWDPTSSTVTFGGRTDNAQMPTHLLAALKPLDDPAWFATIFPDCVQSETPVTVYGEGYGAKIQKGGGKYRQDQGFIVFDVRVGRWWLKPTDVTDVAEGLGVEAVPFVGQFSLDAAVAHVHATGIQAHQGVDPGQWNINSRWGEVSIEGIVGTPIVDLLDRGGSRVIAKLKVEDFVRVERERNR